MLWALALRLTSLFGNCTVPVLAQRPPTRPSTALRLRHNAVSAVLLSCSARAPRSSWSNPRWKRYLASLFDSLRRARQPAPPRRRFTDPNPAPPPHTSTSHPFPQPPRRTRPP